MAKNTTALAVIEERKMQCISQEGEEQIRGILESLADVNNLAKRLPQFPYLPQITESGEAGGVGKTIFRV